MAKPTCFESLPRRDCPLLYTCGVVHASAATTWCSTMTSRCETRVGSRAVHGEHELATWMCALTATHVSEVEPLLLNAAFKYQQHSAHSRKVAGCSAAPMHVLGAIPTSPHQLQSQQLTMPSLLCADPAAGHCSHSCCWVVWSHACAGQATSGHCGAEGRVCWCWKCRHGGRAHDRQRYTKA